MSPEWQETIIHAISGTPAPIEVPHQQSSLVKVLAEDQSLTDALTYSIERWRVFLHPRQRQAVEDKDSLLTCIVGGPGTGKSVVCAHRAASLGEMVADDEIVVVFTYSINLASDLKDIIANLVAGQSFLNRRVWIVPCQNVSALHNRECRTPITIEDGTVVLRQGHSAWRVKHIIVDEFQDLPVWFVEWLVQVKELANDISITVAMDANQTIFRIGHTKEIKHLLEGAVTRNLSFCYRMTNALLENAFSVLSRYAVEYSDALDIGIGLQMPLALLSGPKVRYIPANSQETLLNEVRNAITNLEQKYDNSRGLVVIHLQYWNPHFAKNGKVDPFADALKADPVIGRYYRFASLTKGKEYFAGVVVCPKDFMAHDTGKANVMRLNTLYVALTRVRYELIFVYADDAPVLPYLPIT